MIEKYGREFASMAEVRQFEAQMPMEAAFVPLNGCKVCKQKAIAEVVVDHSLSHYKTHRVCGLHMEQAWDAGYVVFWPAGVRICDQHTNRFEEIKVREPVMMVCEGGATA